MATVRAREAKGIFLVAWTGVRRAPPTNAGRFTPSYGLAFGRARDDLSNIVNTMEPPSTLRDITQGCLDGLFRLGAWANGNPICIPVCVWCRETHVRDDMGMR